MRSQNSLPRRNQKSKEADSHGPYAPARRRRQGVVRVTDPRGGIVGAVRRVVARARVPVLRRDAAVGRVHGRGRRRRRRRGPSNGSVEEIPAGNRQTCESCIFLRRGKSSTLSRAKTRRSNRPPKKNPVPRKKRDPRTTPPKTWAYRIAGRGGRVGQNRGRAVRLRLWCG